MISETLALLIKMKKTPKKSSEFMKFAMGEDYLPFSFKDMFRHLKKKL